MKTFRLRARGVERERERERKELCDMRRSVSSTVSSDHVTVCASAIRAVWAALMAALPPTCMWGAP